MKKKVCIFLSVLLISSSLGVLADDKTGYTLLETDVKGEHCGCGYLCEEELCENCLGCDDCGEHDHIYIVDGYTAACEYSDTDAYAVVNTGDYMIDKNVAGFSDYVLAANSHTHTPKFTYEPIDNSKHYYQKTCTSCGKMLSKGNQNHQPKNSKGDGFTQLNDKKHKTTYTCKLCGKQYTKEMSHSFKTKVEKNGNDSTYHKVIKYCQNCGYRASATTAKHSFSKGTCTKCGFQNTAKAYKAGGVCATYLAKGWNDLNIYANCPKCGSYSATVTRTQTIKKNQVTAGGYRVNVYHQHVKCNSCGNTYCNKCYAEFQ